ncbi:MAG: hypothetical protein A2418_00375 [Candidatus Brennerbacteria bacterium RIFOXYC1_FULL_41_11]|uniref:Uncharacterized protein n=1 Tax=Candidatus Brennerbacteria bacterium RIFOXYD1_FULL_41_16 TaxID=1797529 RepID=A0A1G1XKX2_9BACT|nr:MAG: hypothetical protein A2391_01835 [Candidatus Brennerbacteria bacterium RIFOXYB1_FULL_41_13]OGY39692.1 MAG: hypothetical protein A2418_00375 [Candidatus Brennerbacteria bacterium RIFOXYC1_FULL_41_11]OGY40316.1 MAG: hypothetical protein A2570_03500 [Candidatus Brennerbacteria bacterium RIFOXYD1_FULL_41_16]
MKNKTIFILLTLMVALFAIGTIAQAITLKDFFEKPLPSATDFMEKAIEWFKWLWSKIIYYMDSILGWTLDNVLTNIWKFFVWLWNLIKDGILTGWGLIDQIARMLASGSGIDWGNIQWPWNN